MVHSNFRIEHNKMENIAVAFEMMVNYFTNADELMNFAATLGIQDSNEVRFRLFQLRNAEYGDDFVSDQLNNILYAVGESSEHDNFETALQYVQE